MRNNVIDTLLVICLTFVIIWENFKDGRINILNVIAIVAIITALRHIYTALYSIYDTLIELLISLGKLRNRLERLEK